MKQLNNKPWFLPLLVVFFILHGVTENFGFIEVSELLKIGLIIFSFVLAGYFAVKLIAKEKLYAALIIFFISAWLLFFGAIHDSVKTLPLLNWLHRYVIFLPFMLATILAFIFLIRNKRKMQHRLCLYLNILLLIYCIFDLSTYFLKWLPLKKSTSPPTINFQAGVAQAKPNVYLLVFDEYPGYKSLKDSFAFANDSLYHFLSSKDFKILPTFANYNLTFYDMASMLNMRYVAAGYQPLANTMMDDQQRLKEINDASVIRQFEAMGYSFTNYSIFDILGKASPGGNAAVVTQSALLTNKIFFYRIFKDLGWHFFSGRYNIPLVERWYKKDDRVNKLIEKKLLEGLNGNNTKPRFIYAHFNMPHPPIFCDSLGNYLPNAQIADLKSYTDKPLFLSYLKFANKKIVALVNAVTAKDSNAIIIVMSDHGYRAYNTTNLAEPLYFDNICAIRMPGKAHLPMMNKWSNVNLFPYLFNCAFNQKMRYLADSSVFLSDKISGN